MYAIVDIAGQQFKVEKDQKLFVHRLEGEEGKQISFDRVLLIDNGTKIAVGDPVVKGAEVSARILSHMKGDKVLVFKKKRRKGYQKLNGHRQYMTQIQIESISEKAGSKPAVAKTVTPVATPDEAPVAVASVATEKSPAKKPATKKPAAKNPADKKPAAKKPTAKKPAAKKPAGSKSAEAKSDN